MLILNNHIQKTQCVREAKLMFTNHFSSNVVHQTAHAYLKKPQTPTYFTENILNS